jgi:Response regulator containing CheY-like receiver domain and AraC-type DNA-binding domain
MYNILIAEDELIERMVLKKTLKKRLKEVGEVFEAENGKKAVEIFHNEKIHIAILDIEMPVMKGIDVAELMRKEDEDICIIFLTAYDKFEYAKRAVSVRALEYLLKPYAERELILVLEEALHIVQKKNKDKQIENNHKEIKDNNLKAENEQLEILKIEEAENKNLEKVNIQSVNSNNISVEQIISEEKANEDSQKSNAGIEELNEYNAEIDNIKEDNLNRLNILVSFIEEYIKTNYMYEISMHEAARAINYSEPYFCKMFKQQFGQNFTAYLTEYRINMAKKILVLPNISVKEVGSKVGYSDSSYFTRVFRKLVGVTPTEYRLQTLKEL